MLTVLYWVLSSVLPLGVRADDQADGAVGVDVVGAVLGVVLDDEDRRLGPGLAVRDRLDEPAQGQVVAGDAGLGRERAGRGAGGVVLAQAHDDEPGQVAVLLELAELLEEDRRRCRCRGTALPALATPKSGQMWPTRPGTRPSIRNEPSGWLTRRAVLAVAAIGQAVAGAGVPEVARRGVGEVAVVVVVDARAARVGQGPVPGDVVGVVRHRRPGVAVGRDVAVAVEVVEQDELLGQLVVVGRDLAAEHHQRRVAVAPGDVAEDLVVGPVLLDDVDAHA